MEIPYTVHARPDTGLANFKLGTWLFLASELMLFGGLFASYIFLKIGAPTWPDASHILSVPLATLNTAILISSSVTVIMAWASLMKKNFGKFRVYMILTILCSIGFMVIKAIEYTSKFHHTPAILPSTHNFWGIYFTMTGLHGLHVVGGLVVFLYLLGPGSTMWKTEPERFINRVEGAGLYWHFVDLVWIFLFPTLYLLG